MLVPHYSRSFPMPSKLTSHEIVNEKEVSVWSSDGPTQGRCLWEWHGVWGWDKKKNEAIVLRENYFVKHPMSGQKVARIKPSFRFGILTLFRLTFTPTFTIHSFRSGQVLCNLCLHRIRSYLRKQFPMR